jgi:hypothetical protein
MGQVIRMDSTPRPAHHDWEAKAALAGFEKALGLVKGLEPATDRERRVAIENWAAAGVLSEAERGVALDFYGMGLE